MRTSGKSAEVIFCSHDDASNERWSDLATWIEAVWKCDSGIVYEDYNLFGGVTVPISGVVTSGESKTSRCRNGCAGFCPTCSGVALRLRMVYSGSRRKGLPARRPEMGGPSTMSA